MLAKERILRYNLIKYRSIYESCPSYQLFYTYDAYGKLSSIRRILANGQTENYGVYCNMFGDVIALYDVDGMLVAKYTYDSWGKLLSVADATNNNIMGDNDIWTQNSIRYRGYVYDEDTQLYYLQSRYYDPETCRFINADDASVLAATPVSMSGKNLFTYCDCNPIIRIDAEGTFWGTILGAATGIISGAIDAKKGGYSIWAGMAAGGITGAMSGFIIDATVATGGVAAFAFATIGSGVIDVVYGAITSKLGDESYTVSEIISDFVLGSIFGALDFGLSGGSLEKVGGNLWENLKKNFLEQIIPKPRKYRGVSVSPSPKRIAKHIAGNVLEDVLTSATFDIFSELINMVYRI